MQRDFNWYNMDKRNMLEVWLLYSVVLTMSQMYPTQQVTIEEIISNNNTNIDTSYQQNKWRDRIDAILCKYLP